MRESLVNMENSRTFADATKTVVSHSVRANGNRSRHQVVSLFYRPSVSRTLVVCPQTAAVQKDLCALRGTAVFVATGRAAVPLLNRLVKKATMQQEEIWKDIDLQPIDGEEWRDIEGFNGRYVVSNMGRVKNTNWRHTGKSKLMTEMAWPYGYKKVHLGDKKYFVHRLVAQAFIGNIDGMEINHLNGNPSDNRVTNLEICTRNENMRHSWEKLGRQIWSKGIKGSAAARSKPIYAIDENGIVRYTAATQREMAALLGVSRSSLMNYMRGATAFIQKYKNWKFIYGERKKYKKEK